MKLEGKNIIITGAASGIGKALLEELASSGANAIWGVDVDANADLIEKTCSELGSAKVSPYVCDLSAKENIDMLFLDAQEVLGNIDVFIANAGFSYYERLQEPDYEHIEKLFKVDVFSPIYAFEKMQALNRGRDHKTVITASAQALMGVPGYAIYAGAKASLDRFADAHRWEMKKPKELMLVYPISTRTRFFDAAGAGVPHAWPSQSPDTVARAMLDGIQRDKQRVYPSLLFRATLLLKRILPIHRLVLYPDYFKFRKWDAQQHKDD